MRMNNLSIGDIGSLVNCSLLSKFGANECSRIFGKNIYVLPLQIISLLRAMISCFTLVGDIKYSKKNL